MSQNNETFFYRLYILANIIYKHPEKLEIDDYQQLLQLVADFQQTITHSIHISIISIVCNILMEKFKSILTHDIINETFCLTLWHKMAQTAFHTTNSTLFTENIRFIQLFFRHEQILPKNLIVTLLKTLLSFSMEKTNDSIELVGLILKNFNVKSIENGTEIQLNALNWLYPTKQNLNLKQLMKSDKDISLAKLAEVTVLCIFSKIKANENCQVQLLSSYAEKEEFANYQLYTKDLCDKLQYKSLNKLILSTSHQIQMNDKKSIQLPMKNELKSVINEEMFQKLFDIFNERDTDTDESDDNHLAKFIAHSSKIILYTNIVNQLIAYESLDNEYFHKNFLIKRIILKVEQINMALSNLMNEIHNKEAMDILNKLSEIFCYNFNTVLCEMFYQQNLKTLINWLIRQTQPEEIDCSLTMCVELKTYENLSFVDSIRYKSFMILSYLCVGTNMDDANDIIINYPFDFDYNGDICIVLELIKVSPYI